MIILYYYGLFPACLHIKEEEGVPVIDDIAVAIAEEDEAPVVEEEDAVPGVDHSVVSAACHSRHSFLV